MTPALRDEPTPPVRARVLSLDRAAIEQGLARRQRYKYVTPRVVAEDGGWKVVSPNCSRAIDPDGGEIDIAWLRPGPQGWLLHARDHAAGTWVLRSPALPLHQAIALLCEDPNREFWQ